MRIVRLLTQDLGAAAVLHAGTGTGTGEGDITYNLNYWTGTLWPTLLLFKVTKARQERLEGFLYFGPSTIGSVSISKLRFQVWCQRAGACVCLQIFSCSIFLHFIKLSNIHILFEYYRLSIFAGAGSLKRLSHFATLRTPLIF